MAVLVRVLQKNRTDRRLISINNEIYYKELAHMIMEAEKSHDLLSFKLVCWLKA